MRDIEKLRAALKQRITFSDNGNLRMSAEGAEPSPTDYIPCQRQELEQAIAALEAAATLQPGEGWKMVPVEPTEAMLTAGGNEFSRWHQNTCYPHAMDVEKFLSAKDIHKAMLSAAPSPVIPSASEEKI